MATFPVLSATLATYNVAPFLSDCLDSILNQTFSDFELVCIDDGSKDETVKILRKYAKIDARIRLIENPVNQGLAVIRNQSLKEAKGKYIFFLDGDDLYDTQYFEKALNLAEKEDAEMVLADYLAFYKEEEIHQLQNTPSALESLNPKDKMALLRRPSFAWLKLIRISVAKDLGIHFPPGYTRQDIPVHWRLVTALDRISVLPEKLVFYRQQPSATTAQKNEKLFHLAHIMDIVKKEVLGKSENLWNIYYKEFYRQQLNLLFGMYDNIHPSLKPKALGLIQERVSEEHIQCIKEENSIRKQAKWFYLGLEGSQTERLKYHLWKFTRKFYRKMKGL